MVVAPVPTTAIVMATSGACKRNNNTASNKVFDARNTNEFNKFFDSTTRIEENTSKIKSISSIIISS
jgi:hypothetical protein